MKKMMKFISLVLALLLVLCASGCKKEAAAPADQTPQTTAAADTETEATQTEGESAPTESTPTEPTAGEPTQPTASDEAQSTTDELYEYDFEMDSELDWEEEIGTGPMITLTWQTYDGMSETEKEAYRACFTNQAAFDSWEEMALLDYDSSLFDEDLYGTGSLNLKEIISMLIGQEL